MIRYTLLTIFIMFLCVYAWKDWYRSLCGLIVMMAFIERYDMPRQMLGIMGLNPWNLTMLFILAAWFFSRKRENLQWNMPKEISFLLIYYLIVIFVGFARMVDEIDAIHLFYINANFPERPSVKDFIVNGLINSLKYVIPGLLLFHGCNSKSRLYFGIGAILLTSLLLGLQIIKWMPITEINDSDALSARALRVLDRNLGYHRVDLAALMAGGSWAFFVSRQMFAAVWQQRAVFATGILLILSLALTGGRTGYGTWVCLGMMVAVLRWRKLLFGIPIAIVLIVSLVPAVRDRMLEGFSSDSEVVIVGEEETDLTSVTSGRILVWPTVIDRILEEPLVGYGREGFHSSGASAELFETIGQTASGFNHPHNAYFQLILDNGLIGAFPILLFFYLTMVRSAKLFRDRDSPLLSAAGGVCLVFTGAQLIASIGAQSFYPRAGVVLMWCSIGLMYAAWSGSRYGRRSTEAVPAQVRVQSA